MTDFDQLEKLCPGEVKRQREALRRKLQGEGVVFKYVSIYTSISLSLSLFLSLAGLKTLSTLTGLPPGLVEKFAAARSSTEKPQA